MLEGPLVDRITLVAACTLTVDPKSMHVLIGHQSGGEPWSLTVPVERHPQVYRSAREGVLEAHKSAPPGHSIRIGLADLVASPGTASFATLIPCPNISMAARQITQLSAQWKLDPHFTADSTHREMVAYHGSWNRPDNKFADTVLISLAKGDAPNFDVPGDIGDRSNDVGLTRALPVRAFPRHARLLATNNSRAGRARHFPQGGASSAAAVQAVGMQIGRRSQAS
jgi:hypothetical protein